MPSTRIDYCSHPDCLDVGKRVLIKGRGLCRKCYNKGFRQGWLHDWKAPGKYPHPLEDAADGEDMAAPPPSPPQAAPRQPEPKRQAAPPAPPQQPSPRPLTVPVGSVIRKQARKTVKKISQDLRVSVDFAAAAHVLEELKVRADRDMRPVPMQILWELKQALAARGEAA
jgi:hypothetical protein